MGKASRGKRKGVPPSDHQGKLSVRLVELIAPYESACEDRKAFERLVALGSAAWNLSTLPPDSREEPMLQILELLPSYDRAHATTFILRLLAEKEQRFPADKRFIAKAQVFEDGNEYRVSVASLRVE